jgi:hypothetical protein
MWDKEYHDIFLSQFSILKIKRILKDIDSKDADYIKIRSLTYLLLSAV